MELLIAAGSLIGGSIIVNMIASELYDRSPAIAVWQGT